MRLAKSDEDAAHVLQGAPAIAAAIAGFHYQQAAEKLLKALLALKNIDYPRTHNLNELTSLVENAGYNIPVDKSQIEELTPFAVTFRYVEDDDQFDPILAEALVRQLREWVIREVG